MKTRNCRTKIYKKNINSNWFDTPIKIMNFTYDKKKGQCYK